MNIEANVTASPSAKVGPVGVDEREGGGVSLQTRTLGPLAEQVAKYASLFICISILSSWFFNVEYFRNVDGNIYAQAILPVLTVNDYLSTTFIVAPFIITAFLVVNAVSFVIGKAVDVRVAGVPRIANDKIAFVRFVVFLPVILVVYAFLTKVGMKPLWRIVNYICGLLLCVFIGSYIVISEQNLFYGYVALIFLLGFIFLVLYAVREIPVLSASPKRRIFYSSFIILISVGAGSALCADLMFDLSWETDAKSVDLVFPDNGKLNMNDKGIKWERVRAIRSLENGMFILYSNGAGKSGSGGEPNALFVSWERGVVIKKSIQLRRAEPVGCRYARQLDILPLLARVPGFAPNCYLGS